MQETRVFDDLQSARLSLRRLQVDDAPFVLRHFSDVDVCRYLYDAEPFTSLEEALALIGHYDNRADGDHNRWGIVLKDAGTLMGTCGYHFWDRDNRSAEIGYDLGPAYWGHGYMAEALKAALCHGFEIMLLNRVQAFVALENDRSSRLLERLGFAREGTVREKHLFRGRYHDHYCFSLLRREWSQPAPSPLPA